MAKKSHLKKHKERIYPMYIIPFIGICALLYYLFIYKSQVNPPKSIAKEPSSVVLPTFTPTPLDELKIHLNEI